jgi:hypothetical protein
MKGTPMLSLRIKFAATALAVAALAAGGAAPAALATHHHHHGHHAGIPQHDGGDRDADNNGGPSDGDGDI